MRKHVAAVCVALLLASCASAPRTPGIPSPVETLAENPAASFEELMQKGDGAYRAGDMDQALFNYVKAAQADASAELPYLRMAAIYELKQQSGQLIQALRDALARNPANAAAHENLGFALLRQG